MVPSEMNREMANHSSDLDTELCIRCPLLNTFPRESQIPFHRLQVPHLRFSFSLGSKKDEQIETSMLKQIAPRSPCTFLKKIYIIAANGACNACKVPRRNLCPKIVPTCYLMLLLKYRKEPDH